jgi:2-polyprenyl-6-methoxyphenol hydroxylase-like FAD-dependent oxidoreductase
MTPIYDVVIIGYGPVGMVAAALLGRAGHRVAVFERYQTFYNLPRAATFDHEVMRVLQALGCVEDILPGTLVWTTYEWVNGAGDLLIKHVMSPESISGWAENYLMYQPTLEDALHRAVLRLDTVEIHQGWRAIELVQHADRVDVTVERVEGVGLRPTGERKQVSGRFLLGCDGGNSFVRQACGIRSEDLGFRERWLVCDFKIKRPVDLPLARQLCDPAQPGVMIQLGPAHRRFSFMILPGETVEEAVAPANVWRRVSRWVTPDDLELIRSVSYTFQSLIAERWRDGRVFLVGDAAHQMPPFLGQGMCSGIRDAANLAWKLDLVLKGQAAEALLDSYMSEREPHVRAITLKAIELGKIQTMRDPEAARRRDAELIGKRMAKGQEAAVERIEYPRLETGIIDRSLPGAGELFIQARVRSGDREGLFDDVVGRGFVVLALDGAPQDSLSASQRCFWQHIGGLLVRIDRRAGATRVQDLQGKYTRWFDEHGCVAVIVRPDFYVYGGLRSWRELPDAVDALQRRLQP